MFVLVLLLLLFWFVLFLWGRGSEAEIFLLLTNFAYVLFPVTQKSEVVARSVCRRGRRPLETRICGTYYYILLCTNAPGGNEH